MILIEGCPRSGTSIVGELLRDHPWCQRYAFEEWWPFSGAPLVGERTVAKMPRHFDPTPGLGCDPWAFEPGPTIWVQRPMLDTVASLRPIMAERWGCWPVPNVDAAGWVERAAGLWWWQRNVGLPNLRDARGHVLVVDYIGVIEDPWFIAEQILRYVGWPADVAAVDAWADRISDQSGHSEADHQSFWTTPHDRHVGRWRTDLTPDEAERASTTIDRLEQP